MPLFDDSTTWLAIGLASGAAGLALIAILLASLLARGRKYAVTQAESALAESNARFESMISELAQALERAQEDGHRSRLLGGIRETIDLESTAARTLEVASAIARVDAALIVVPDAESNGEPRPFVLSTGLTEEEVAAQPIGGPPDGRVARTVTLSYRYAPDADDEDLICGGLAVPLRGDDGEPVGTLAVFWRGGAGEASEEQIESVEELAAAAGPALENARRFRQARQLADLDALTGLHNRRYFHETLARECARAQRYDRRLALVVFDVDNFKEINDRVGHLAGDELLAEVGQRVLSVVRTADVACRIGGDEFAIILPEATTADAEQLHRRLQFAVASRAAGAPDRIHLSAGIAELRPDDDATTFFERADEALYCAKEAGKGRAVTALEETG